MEKMYTPNEVSELLGDLFETNKPGYRAVKVIRFAERLGIGRVLNISQGRWEFTRAEVDMLKRRLEHDLQWPYSVADVEQVTGRSKTTIIKQAKKLGIGHERLDSTEGSWWFNENEVKQIQAIEPGKRGRKAPKVDNPDVLTTTQMAEVLQADFPHLTNLSLKDKIRRYARMGVAGWADMKQESYMFNQDDIARLRSAMRGDQVAA